MDWRDAIKIVETLDDHILNALYGRLSNNIPNTYVFTKNIAESMINDYKDILPVVVYRPSVVTAAEKEPVPGFIDNFNGKIHFYL